MPPSNFFFQIGCFLARSRTTMPPSADTRTLTGSVVRPIRTLGAGGADRSVPVEAAEDAEADGDRAGADGEAAAGMTIASAAAASEVQRPDNVIRPTTLSRRRGHFPAARPGTPLARRNSARRARLV